MTENTLLDRTLYNILNEIPSILLEDQIIQKKLGFDGTSEVSDRLNLFLDKYKNPLSRKNFREIWETIELISLFSKFHNMYKIEKSEISLNDFKSLFSEESSNEIIIFELFKNPLIYYICKLSQGKRSNIDKFLERNTRDYAYIIPKHRIMLMNSEFDTRSNEFKSSLEGVCGKIEPHKNIGMHLTKYYEENKLIERLRIYSEFQVTGFAGFKHIEFIGDDVKQGLFGLHKRHDIRVHLDQIGPMIGVDGKNIELSVGTKVRIKNFEAIDQLRKIMYGT